MRGCGLLDLGSDIPGPDRRGQDALNKLVDSEITRWTPVIQASITLPAVAPVSSASASTTGTTGAEGWPPIVVEQSSKSSAWAAVPLTSAACRTEARRPPRPHNVTWPGAAAVSSTASIASR